KERAAKRLHRFQRQTGFKNALPRALLHFVRGAVGAGDNNQLRQPLRRALSIFRNLNDAIGDRARFARTGGCDHREICIQFISETLARLLVCDRRHFGSSLFSSEKAGCVIVHFVLRRSGSIGRVASGYFLTNPKSLWTGPSIPNTPLSCIRCSARQKSFWASTCAS